MDVDVASASVGSRFVEELFANLALPHAAQSKGCNGHCERKAFVFVSSEVLGAGGDGRQVHAARAHAYRDECQHHDAKRPSMPVATTRTCRRSALVCKGSQKVSEPKETARNDG